MRQQIESDRMRIHLGWAFLASCTRLGLSLQFFDRARAASRHGLITGSENAEQAEHTMKGIERHKCDSGRAIRIGDKTAMPRDILSIDLWDHERHVGFHPKGG